MTRRLLPALLLFALTAPLVAEEEADFVIIASPGRPEVSLQREELSRIFLRKQPLWPEGGDAEPIDQDPEQPVRERFTKFVHQRQLKSILLYWQQQIFSGRGYPPVMVRSDTAVVEYVARAPRAIGYVSRGTRLDGVKALRIE
jgi:ABC-type phosphate transport system substrate-binding protein